MMKLLLTLMLISSGAFAAISDLDKADLNSTNILKNPGFESGFAEWSKTGGTWSLQTSGSKLGFGKQSLCWDSSAAAQKLQSSLVAIPNALKGKNGEMKISVRVSSGTATHKIRVTDGTNTVGGSGNEVSIYNTSEFQPYSLNIPIPTSGSLRLEMESVASNEPEVCMDIGYIGEATNLSSMLVKNVFSAKITLSGAVSRENTPWIDSCTNANPVVCTFKTGIFSSVPNCQATTEDTIADAYQTITAISTTSISMQSGNFLESVLQRTDRRDFTLTCTRSTDAQLAVNSLQGDYGPIAYTPIFAGFGTVTGISATHYRRGKFLFVDGKATAGSCSATPGLISLPSGLSIDTTIWSGSEHDAGRIIVGNDTGGTHINYLIARAATSTTDVLNTRRYGPNGDSPLGVQNQNAIGPCSGDFTFSFKVPISGWTETQKAPILIGSITSGAQNAERYEHARILNSGSCSIDRQSGTWISSVNRPSGGICDITFTSGYFSTPPDCTCTSESGSGYLCIISTASTTTSISIETANTGSPIDANFNIHCAGAK